MENNFKKYQYKGLTPNEEGDIIGYALIKAGTILENLTEIDNECIACMLNSQPLKDIAAIRKIQGELFINAIHYSKYGNYLGEESEYFIPVEMPIEIEETKKTQLKIDEKYLLLGNNPELAEIFSREDVQELLKRILSDIEEYSFKDLLKEGHQKFCEDIIDQLKNSFEILESSKEDREAISITKVKRSFDGKIFSTGDLSTQNGTKIGRMYINSTRDDKLKIRLDYNDNKGTITWREINQL